jgi:hypothetical protein
MKYNVFKYGLKVWLTSPLLTPVILLPIALSRGRTIASSFSAVITGYLIIAITLLLASLIPWFIMLLFLERITNSRLTAFASKLIILLGVVILPGAFLFIGAWSSHTKDLSTGMTGWVGFVIATSLCLWFYKLKSPYAAFTSQPTA